MYGIAAGGVFIAYRYRVGMKTAIPANLLAIILMNLFYYQDKTILF